jgi:hypothetical protein
MRVASTVLLPTVGSRDTAGLCSNVARTGQWTARSYDLGGTTCTTITDPTGRERRCSSYVFGSERITRSE